MTTKEMTMASSIGHRQIVTSMPIDELEEPRITGADAGGVDDRQRGMRRIVNPAHLALLIGPVALVVVIPLIHIHALARESMWIWLVVLAAAPLVSLGVDHFYRARPSGLTLNLRTAEHAATVTFVIYLTGWGPALCIAFAFMALENVSHGGSRVWPTSATWIIVGLIVGQIFIWQGWAPSKLSKFDANSLAIMSGFILLFVIRLAGATMERKEEGRVVHPTQRGSLPLADPELVGHDGRRGRGWGHQLCQSVSHRTVGLRTEPTDRNTGYGPDPRGRSRMGDGSAHPAGRGQHG